MTSECFLVDTSTWVEALRRGGSTQAREWLRRALLEGKVVLAPPVKAELLSGALSEEQFAELKRDLGALPLLGREADVWDVAAESNFRLRRRGISVPLLDVLIASWAAVHGCTLVHHDKHYEMIKEVLPHLATLTVPPRGGA
ncbi:MAG: PIN domain nuclease [Firmicutes bacterium]|nr:PIN domain nuclease [Bacillota bacterium]